MRTSAYRHWGAGAGLLAALATIGAHWGRVPAEPRHAGDRSPTSARAKGLRPGKLPVRFEANSGQFDARIAYVGRARHALLALTDDAATLVLPMGASLRWRVDGGRRVRPVASEAMPTRSNYFVGSDPARWRTGVPSFARVTYPGVREGVDLVYHGDDGRLEYDFVVAPGADVTGLAMAVEGAEGLSIDATGSLVITTPRGTLVQPAPRVYQLDGADERIVRASYRLVDEHRVAFEVAAYDHSRGLVIDPDVAYATYLGGSGDEDEVRAIGIDAAGSAYVAGVTLSADFPLKSAFDPTFTGVSVDNLFVAKLDPTGSSLVYATYVGGQMPGGYALMSAFQVDRNGHAYMAGSASTDFPLKSPMQTTGGAFLLKFAQDGGLAYSTRFGGTGGDEIFGLAVDASGSAYLTGETGSSDFPTKGAPYPSFQGGDFDAFVAKMTPSGSALVFSTYLGSPGTDAGHGIALDPAGRVYVAGETSSASFPVKGAAQAKYGGGERDAFIASLSADGASLIYATFLGGSGSDIGDAVAVDNQGNAYVTGSSMVGGVSGPVANDFPSTLGALYIPFADNFTAKLRAGGASFAYAALGPGGNVIDVDSAGNAYLGYGCNSIVVNPTGSNTSSYGLAPNGAICPPPSASALDSAGNVYLAGSIAADGGLAPTPGAFQRSFAGGSVDAFVMKIGTRPLPDASIALDDDDAGPGALDASPGDASSLDDSGATRDPDASTGDAADNVAGRDASAPEADGGGAAGGTSPRCSTGPGERGRPWSLAPFVGLGLLALHRRARRACASAHREFGPAPRPRNHP